MTEETLRILHSFGALGTCNFTRCSKCPFYISTAYMKCVISEISRVSVGGPMFNETLSDISRKCLDDPSELFEVLL